MSRVTELFEIVGGGGAQMFDALAEVSRHRRQLARWFLDSKGGHGALQKRLADVEEVACEGYPWEPSAEDDALAAAIVAAWGDGDAPPANALMASMALAPAHHFPKPRSLAGVPPWLRRAYVRHLTARARIFTRMGEAEQYAAHGAAVMKLLAAAIVDEHLPEAAELADIAMACDSTMTYFSEASLKAQFADKARILEWLMLARGYRPGWSFQFVADRPLRIGIILRSLVPSAETAYLLAHLAGREVGQDEVILYTSGESSAEVVNAFLPWVSRIIRLPEGILGAVVRISRDQLDICYIAANVACAVGVETVLAAHRLARVQINGGASPASPGFLSSDLFISGPDCDPAPDAQADYTEPLVLLPGALRQFCYAHDRQPATVGCAREAFGIPSDHLIFFSGANYFKHTPEITALWAEILARAPRSGLVLMPFNPNWASDYPVALFLRRLHDALRKAGVALDRVRVVEKVPARADLHHLISKTDVYLDSFPYSGACSLVDPIAVGLPIVARAGRRLREAQGGALLAAEGLEVCTDVHAYVERAVRLALDKAFRDEQTAIARRVAKAPPACVQTQAFARRFQRLCADLHHAYLGRYAGLRAGAAARAKAAVQEAAEAAVRYASPVFRHTYDIDIVARILTPYLKTLVAEGEAAGRVTDVGAGDGVLSSSFTRVGFRVDALDPDPAFAEALAKAVGDFPERARHDAAPLSEPAPETRKGAKKAASMPSAALRRSLCADDIDVVRFDASRIGFDLDAGLALVGQGVRAVMVNFTGAHRLAADRGMAAMKARGFASVLLAYGDLSRLDLENWTHELLDVTLDPAKITITGKDRGVLLFHREGDTTFLAYLAQMLEACGPARTRPWVAEFAASAAARVARPEGVLAAS